MKETKDLSGEVDVLVVGGGGSGLAAAVEAASLGRSVMLIEKFERLGGSTAWSVGSISATNTAHQLAKGIKDCPDAHFDDLGRFCAKVSLPDNLALRRILVDNVTETLSWLESLGVVFHGPLLQPPHRQPRMHNVLPNSRAYIYHLSRRARKLGVDIRVNCALDELNVEQGTVVGAMCRTSDGMMQIGIRGGVILATGDFAGNEQMRHTHLPEIVRNALPINPVNTGDGHRLIERLGGRMLNAQHYLAGVRFPPPPPKLVMMAPPWRFVTRFVRWSLANMPERILRPFIMSFLTTVLQSSPELYAQGAILVNKQGLRFTDETTHPAKKLAEQPGGEAYIIMDAALARKFSGAPHHVSTAPGIAFGYIPDYRRSRRDIFHEDATLAGLAKKLGINETALETSLSAYNDNRDGTDDMPARGTRPRLETGPFVALGPVRHYITFSDSGVAVNEQHEVLGAGDQPIKGLFAVGFVGMGGMLLEGLGHHLGWAFTSGRRAGRFAAYRASSQNGN